MYRTLCEVLYSIFLFRLTGIIPASLGVLGNESRVLRTSASKTGIFPVNLKRKMEYKTSHKVQYISVEKVLHALETLKQLGNKYYQFIPDLQTFNERCKTTDKDGYEFLFDDKVNTDEVSEDKPSSQSKTMNDEMQSNAALDSDSDTEQEMKDSIKKWQFNYNTSTCFLHNYPEIDYKEDTSKEVSVAPGEGKTPTNLLQETDWDIKTFPCLYPDGKNSLHAERKVNLKEQDYFVQRILNKDPRYAQNLGFVFASAGYIEMKQIARNKGISYIKGRKNKQNDGSYVYSLDDPCSVLDSIKNTPRYWQKLRYELIARLENLGPFIFFFTLSCGDLR